MPSGRIPKKTRREAVHRIADGELDTAIEIVESLGAFKHRYESSDVAGIDSKHHLANGYLVDVVDGKLDPDNQHDEFRMFRSVPEQCHEYVRMYVDAALTLQAY